MTLARGWPLLGEGAGHATVPPAAVAGLDPHIVDDGDSRLFVRVDRDGQVTLHCRLSHHREDASLVCAVPGGESAGRPSGHTVTALPTLHADLPVRAPALCLLGACTAYLDHRGTVAGLASKIAVITARPLRNGVDHDLQVMIDGGRRIGGGRFDRRDLRRLCLCAVVRELRRPLIGYAV